MFALVNTILDTNTEDSIWLFGITITSCNSELLTVTFSPEFDT